MHTRIGIARKCVTRDITGGCARRFGFVGDKHLIRRETCCPNRNRKINHRCSGRDETVIAAYQHQRGDCRFIGKESIE